MPPARTGCVHAASCVCRSLLHVDLTILPLRTAVSQAVCFRGRSGDAVRCQSCGGRHMPYTPSQCGNDVCLFYHRQPSCASA
eukprot:7091954-Alexandrium_andersonii.AAC.1